MLQQYPHKSLQQIQQYKIMACQAKVNFKVLSTCRHH